MTWWLTGAVLLAFVTWLNQRSQVWPFLALGPPVPSCFRVLLVPYQATSMMPGALPAATHGNTLTLDGAWLIWRGVYVTKFPGIDGQIRLLADWILDAFLPRDITELQLFHEEAVHREHFEPGETVFKTGDFGDKIYFIVKGEATVEREGATVATLRNGDVFGEAALISHHPRNATVRASTALGLVSVSRKAFRELVSRLPGLHMTMQQLMSERLGRDVALHEEMEKPEKLHEPVEPA